MSGLIDNVKLNVDASTADVRGLTKAHDALKKLDLMLQTMQNRIAGLSFKNPFRQSAAQFSSLVKEAGGVKSTSVAALARKLGLPNVAEVQQYARDLEKGLAQEVGKIQRKIDQAWQTVPKRGGGFRRVWSDPKGQSERFYQDQMAQLRAQSLFTSASATSFKTQHAAGKFFEDIGQRMDRTRKDAQGVLNRWLSGEGVAAGTAGPAKAGTTSGGTIPLTIPPSQIIATLGPGTIPLLVSPGQVAGAAGQGAGTAGTAGTAGAKGAAGGKGAAAKALRDALAANELALAEGIKKLHAEKKVGLTGAAEQLKIAKLRENAADQIRAIVGQSGVEGAQADNALKRAATLDTQTQKARANALKKQANLVTQYENDVKAAREAGDKAAQKTAQAELTSARKTLRQQQKQFTTAQKQSLADEAKAERFRRAEGTTPREIPRFPTAQLKGVHKTEIERVLREAGLLETPGPQRANASQRTIDAATRAVQKRNAKLIQDIYLGKAVNLPMPEAARPSRPAPFDEQRQIAQALESEAIQKKLDAKAARDAEAARIKGVRAAERAARTGPPEKPGIFDRLMGGDGRMVTRGLTGFTPLGFTKNLLTVGAWTAAVSALYAPIRLASYSLKQLNDIGLQTARLGQVFRQVGGDTQQLRDDTMSLASATGQSTSDALQAAVQWSRLGLTRKQAAEAVRVSLMGANVAEMTAAETTEHLAAVTAVYGLRVSELEGVLGMLNQTSNTARVTNKDLLQGISNVAAVGKEAGFSLAELQGILGASVEISGQTGSRMGNAVKNILARMSRPDVQEYMRNLNPRGGGGVEMRTPAGGEKSRAEALRELFVVYQGLNEAERTNLAVRVAGMHQANRFSAIMDSYLRGQQLAIDAQLHLNSAQSENTKIIATLKSQVAGLKAEWDKFIVATGMQEYFADLARFGKDALRLLNPGVAGKGRDYSKLTDAQLEAENSFFAGPRNEAMKEQTRRWFDRRTQAGQSTSFMAALMDREQQLDFRTWLQMRAETPYERGEGAFRNTVQQAQMRATAKADQARLFDTVSHVIQRGTPENAKAAADFIEKNLPANLRGAFQAAGGDRGGQVKVLTEARKQALKEQLAAAKDAADAATARKAENEAAQAAKKAEIAQLVRNRPMPGMGMRPVGGRGEREESYTRVPTLAEMEAHAAALAKANDELDELAADSDKMAAAQAKYANAMADVAEDDLQRKLQNQETLNLLQGQSDTMQHLAQMGGMFHAPTAVGQALAEEGVLKAQLSYLKAQQAMMKSRPELFNDAGGQMYAEMDKKIRDATAKLSASEAGRFYQSAQDQLQRGSERGRRGLIPFDYGEDPTEKLLRQRAKAEELIQRLDRPDATLEQRGELLKLEEQQMQINNELMDRRASLERDINQLVVDRNREFRHSLFGAGPGEMLQKLAAFRTAFDNKGNLRSTSQGAFFAMPPGMRSAFIQLNPEFDPQLRDLRREQRRANPGENLDETQNRNANRMGRHQADMIGEAARLGNAMATFTPTLNAAAHAMDQLGSSASATARAVADLGVAVMQLRDQIAGGGGGIRAGVSAAPMGTGGQFGGKGAAVGHTDPSWVEPNAGAGLPRTSYPMNSFNTAYDLPPQ